jgi:hypothetical protein
LQRVLAAAAAAAVGHILTTSIVGVLILMAGRFVDQLSALASDQFCNLLFLPQLKLQTCPLNNRWETI